MSDVYSFGGPSPWDFSPFSGFTQSAPPAPIMGPYDETGVGAPGGPPGLPAPLGPVGPSWLSGARPMPPPPLAPGLTSGSLGDLSPATAPLGQSLTPAPGSPMAGVSYPGPREHSNPIDGGGGASAGPTDIRSAAQQKGTAGVAKAAGGEDMKKKMEQFEQIRKVLAGAMAPSAADVVKPGTPALPRERAMPASNIGQFLAALGRTPNAAGPNPLLLSKLLGRG